MSNVPEGIIGTSEQPTEITEAALTEIGVSKLNGDETTTVPQTTLQMGTLDRRGPTDNVADGNVGMLEPLHYLYEDLSTFAKV